jgi:4-hydroxy-3-methylbut-2-en-1-yl diphosphate reductase
MGMCFGVRDAIGLASHAAATRPLTILGELVHNPTVLNQLRAQGIEIQYRAEEVSTSHAMITAHGTSNKAASHALCLGLTLMDATCPLVRLAHRSVNALVRAGYHPIIIGKASHVEVRGMTDDLDQFNVVENEQDLERVQQHPRFGVIAQTTHPIERVRYWVDRLRLKFPSSEIRFIDTVCQPTKQRQAAAVDLAQQSEVVIVIGGANSNNTRELAATCAKYCLRVFQVENAADMKPEWFANVDCIGITAGTSTLDAAIDEVENRIREWASSLPTFNSSRLLEYPEIAERSWVQSVHIGE